MDVEDQARILDHAYPVSVKGYVGSRDTASLVSVLYDVLHRRLVEAINEIESEKD
jgi:hypothetical protein